MDDTSLAPIDLDVNKTVKKNNLLNELRNSNASLVEYRLFCVYLAHLPMNTDSNVVTFRLTDYAKIAGLKWPKKADLEAQAANLVMLTAKIDTPDGGFRMLNLFSEFSLFRQDDQWMVSLECSRKIAPMIREQKGKFLRYKLYNTILLKSYNQQRLYELLKQYERIGARTISLVDLREFLSVAEDEYPAWGDFSQKLLKRSQQAINENTDIHFEFEPIRAKKRGQPVVSVKFTIKKNKDFVDRLQIEQHMPDLGEAGDYDGEELRKRAPEEAADAQDVIDGQDPDQISLFDVAAVVDTVLKKVFPKFTKGQREDIATATMEYFSELLPEDVAPTKQRILIYMQRKIATLRLKQEQQPIPHPAGYLRTMIQNDTKQLEKDRAAARKELVPDWMRREPDADEVAAVERMMAATNEEPATVGSSPELAARAAELKEALQQ